MLFSSLLALASAALVSATPTKRADNREWINLKAIYGYEGQDLCVGFPFPADSNYLGGAICETGNSKLSQLTTLIALYGVGKSGLLEIPKWGCPTSTGVSLVGASNIPIVKCNIDDKNQFWTIQNNGTVTNDATGTCLTLGKKAPGAPLTLNTCAGPQEPLATAQLFYYNDVSSY
ncbi:hypothetical protein PENSPDRAFT_736776 [Peniophora sp. CONT]|nr:hypothetical protein PENSPDRAFT_736776 [Peniophora sp. CONT]